VNDILSQLTPEQLQALLGLGSLGEEQDLMQQQMEQAQALQNATPEMSPYVSSPLAIGLNNVAGLVNKYRGFQDQQALQGRQQDILGQKTQARGDYLRALMGGQQGAPPLPEGFTPFQWGVT
jgi:hypothetical protein